MRPFLERLYGWPQEHALWWGILLFSIGCLVSIFSPDLRRFITEWPKQRLHSYKVGDAKSRLALLERIHGQSYQLLLWFLSNFVSAFREALALGLIVFALLVATRQSISSFSIWPILGGISLGKAIYMQEVIQQLYTYESSIEQIKGRIKRLEGGRKRRKAAVGGANE